MEGHLRPQIRVICTHRPGSSVHTFRVHLYTHIGFICAHRAVWGWGGVGWANKVHVPVHTQTQQTLSSFFSPADTGTFLGMGWGDNIHVPVHTHRHSNLIIFLAVLQAQALLLADQLPVGWGGVITFMFLCTHRHTKPLGWSVTAGVGWGNNVHVPVHTQAHPTCSSFLLSSRHRHYSFMISYRWGGVGWWDVSMPCSRPTTVSYRHLSFEHLQPYRFLSWNLTPPDFLVCCL